MRREVSEVSEASVSEHTISGKLEELRETINSLKFELQALEDELQSIQDRRLSIRDEVLQFQRELGEKIDYDYAETVEPVLGRSEEKAT